MNWNQLFARKSLDELLTEMRSDDRLKRVLGPISLTSLGVGAVIGAGIFVSTGSAASQVAAARRPGHSAARKTMGPGGGAQDDGPFRAQNHQLESEPRSAGVSETPSGPEPGRPARAPGPSRRALRLGARH
jgi:hypothetical protein